MQTVTLTIRSTNGKEDVDRGIIRLKHLGGIEWAAEFAYDNGRGEVQLVRRPFLFSNWQGNIIALIGYAFSTLDLYHMEGTLDANVPPDLARRLRGGNFEIQAGDG